MGELATLDIEAIARKYHLETPSESVTGRELSPQELEEILMAKSTKRTLETSQSRSVSSAMKSLQEKVKDLEQENRQLKTQDPSQLTALKEQVSFLRAQIEFTQSETQRNKEQFELDRQNWLIEKEHLRQHSKHAEELEKVKRLLKAERKKNAELTQHLAEVQQKHELEAEVMRTSLNTVQQELDQLKFSKCDTSYTKKHSKPREKSARQPLKERPSMRENSRQSVKDSHQGSKKRLRKRSKENRHPRKRSTSSRRRSLSNSKLSLSRSERSDQLNTSHPKLNLPSPSYLSKKPPLPSQIDHLEKEITKLNAEYRKLLGNTGTEGQSFNVLRTKIDEISAEITRKSQELYEAKKKLQDDLKSACSK